MKLDCLEDPVVNFRILLKALLKRNRMGWRWMDSLAQDTEERLSVP